HVREAMTAALPDAADGIAVLGDGSVVDGLLAGRAAVVCGPGLGLAEGTRALVAHVVRRCAAPLVLDADGLNAVAGTELLAVRAGPTVVTPHPGEMARLVGTDTAAVQADRLGTARRLAAATGAVVVLKGARTVIASPDGTAAICPAGNPGMASGGTGDVLAGVVGGLLAQGLAPADAAALAVSPAPGWRRGGARWVSSPGTSSPSCRRPSRTSRPRPGGTPVELREVESRGPADTEALGAALGRAAAGGELIGLSGELGTGKTCLVRG